MTGETSPGATAPPVPDTGGATTPTAPAAENQGDGVSMALWSSMPTRMRDAFDTYAETMQTARDADYHDMDTEEDRLREQFEGDSCDDTEEDLNNFKDEIAEVWEEAKTKWTEFTTEYRTTFQSHEMLAKTMDDRRKTWENDVIPNFGAFDETLRQSQIAQHWKGKAGESYRKQLAPQTTAMSDIKVSSSNAHVAMTTSANLQQVIYNSVYNSVMQLEALVRGMSPSLTDDVWAERIYTMRDNNTSLLEWLTTFKDEYGTPWGSMQDDMITQLSTARENNNELTQYYWPAATSESAGYVPTYSEGAGQSGPNAPQAPPTNQPGQASSGDQSGNQSAEGGGQTADEDTYE